MLSNHVHLILCVDQEQTLAWDEPEVARRWLRLFGGTPLVRSFVSDEKLSDSQRSAVLLIPLDLPPALPGALGVHFVVNSTFEALSRGLPKPMVPALFS